MGKHRREKIPLVYICIFSEVWVWFSCSDIEFRSEVKFCGKQEKQAFCEMLTLRTFSSLKRLLWFYTLNIFFKLTAQRRGFATWKHLRLKFFNVLMTIEKMWGKPQRFYKKSEKSCKDFLFWLNYSFNHKMKSLKKFSSAIIISYPLKKALSCP